MEKVQVLSNITKDGTIHFPGEEVSLKEEVIVKLEAAGVVKRITAKKAEPKGESKEDKA